MADLPSPTAHTFIRRFRSASKPVLLRCDDGNEYVVKGVQAGRMIFNDQVLGRIANRMKAPVPAVALIDVPKELIDAEPQMKHMIPGIAHGSSFLVNVTEREGLMHTDVPENVPRFAQLAGLYGWAYARDHQFIYSNANPYLVYSVDHGHFFPGGPEWTVDSLNEAPPPTPDSTISDACSFEAENWTEVADLIESVSDKVIAEAMDAPPESWNVPTDERTALDSYLRKRRDELVDHLRRN